MTRTETITRASRPQVGDTFQGAAYFMEVAEVNFRFVLLVGEVGELAIPFHKWPNVATSSLNAGATFTPAESHE